MKLIFLGPPGAGKGTLAGLVSKELGIPQISTGDIFREAIKRETELGKKVKEIVGRGDLVPDELTVSLVKERLTEPDAARGYILDGFPRTIPQAEALESFQTLDAVVNFTISDEVVVQRLSGREICKSCGEIYHVKNMPAKVKGVCDACGGPLVHQARRHDRVDHQPPGGLQAADRAAHRVLRGTQAAAEHRLLGEPRGHAGPDQEEPRGTRRRG